VGRLAALIFVVASFGCDPSTGSEPAPLVDAAHDTNATDMFDVSDTPDGGGVSDGGAADAADMSQDDAQPEIFVPNCDDRQLDSDVVTLDYDVAPNTTDLRTAAPSFSNDDGSRYVVVENRFWEALRFQLEHPGEIVGFSVQWTDGGVAPPQAGVYANFGSNQYDFWHDDPLWAGEACSGPGTDNGWTDYFFGRPVTLEQVDSVYVAHYVDTGSDDPLWRFGGYETCSYDDIADCPSIVNMPDRNFPRYLLGSSFYMRAPFHVRLHVRYHESTEPPYFHRVDPFGYRNVGWTDYDNDGWDDLLLSGSRLFRNQAGQGFEEVTEAAGLSGIDADGGAFADYDNDGCLDLFTTNYDPNVSNTLMRSQCDGTFVDVSAQAGILPVGDQLTACGNNTDSKSRSVGWLDYDADGWVDFYVANGRCWSGQYYDDALYRNNGDGTFTDVGPQAGITGLGMPGRASLPVDYDHDGDMDILVTSYVLHRNLFFENQGDGTFVELGRVNGLAGNLDSLVTSYGHSISATWADLNNDGQWDVVESNLAHPRYFFRSDKSRILLGDGTGGFDNRLNDWEPLWSPAGLRYQETHATALVADFDNDTVPDLVMNACRAAGIPEFYWGRGDGTFQIDTYRSGLYFTEYGWASAASDYDHDGDVDLFSDGLFVNDIPDQGHHLSVRVIGNQGSNWAAMGAVVRVRLASGETLMRQVQGGTGKSSQDSLYLHFGLGTAQTIGEISVTFPGGKVVTFTEGLAVDTRLWLFEDGTLHAGYDSPLL
jgi:enediyne biosynthesis protein E4